MTLNQLLFAAVAALNASTLLAAPVLTGETSKPLKSVFYPQDRVVLTFQATGLKPMEFGPELKVTVEDAYGKTLNTFTSKMLADRHGIASVNFKEAPCGKLGFYRVKAALADGTKLVTPWSTRRDGEMTYAVVRDPQTRETVDDAILRFHSCGDPDLVGPTKRRPTGWNQWRHLEPHRPGEYADNPKADTIKLGINPGIYVPPVTPGESWSEADKMKYFKWKPDYPGGYPALSPEGEKVYEKFLRAYVRNLRKQCEAVGYTARIYDVSGEWKHNDEGTRTVEDVLKVYEISHRVVHEEDPEGVVMGIGYDPYFEITRDYLKAGLWKYVDAISTHPYYNPEPVEPNGIIRKIRECRDLVRSLAGRDIPFHSTECGYATRELPALEPVQMKHLARMNLIFVGEGWKGLSFFNGYDYRLEPGFGMAYSLDLKRDHKALGDWGPLKTSPKQVYPALSAVAWFVINSESCGDIPFLGETVWGYVYRHVKTRQVKLALWDWSGERNKLRIKVGAKPVTVADEWGNERTVTPDAKGEIPLELHDMPTYVLGVDPAIWEKADGERAKLAAEARAEQEAKRRAKGILIGKVRPAQADGANALEVELVDVSGKANRGELTVAVKGVPDARRTVPYALAGDETKAVAVPLGAFATNPFLEETVEIEVKMADGRGAKRTDRVNFLVIPRATIAFDGKFGDWAKVPHFKIEGSAFCRSGMPWYRGAKDLSAEAAMAWDETGLLFHFRVRDDSCVVPKAGEMNWGGDAIQISVAKAYRYEETANSWLDLLNVAHTEQTFALTDKGPDCYRHVTFAREKISRGPQQLGKEGLDAGMARTKQSDGTWVHEYEIRIPWSVLTTATPKPGDRYAFAFTINDSDEGEPFNHSRQHGAFELKFKDKFGAAVIGR